MQISLIVAAGGSGIRFRRSLTNQPKRTKAAPSKIFCKLGSLPMIVRSLKAFSGIEAIEEVIVAISRDDEGDLRAAVQSSGLPIRIVRGGKTRAESVSNALRRAKPGSSWIMVHDAARPLVSRKLIQDLIAAARRTLPDGILAARKVVPTIKRAFADGRIDATVDRSNLFEAETPQLVKRRVLVRAYRENPGAFLATDEASLLEAIHADVRVLVHDGWNPKITTAVDLELARKHLMTEESVMIRTGFGKDIHRLVPGRIFWLGGVRIPYPEGPLGHSDGDALLHAISDAVLGAIGAGDIGDWFSDRDPGNKGLRSEKILTAILKEAAQKRFRLIHVDTVIVLEKPKLAGFKLKIRKKLAAMMGLALDHVSVKAKTMEGLGPEGEGKAVSCEAVVTMAPLGDEL